MGENSIHYSLHSLGWKKPDGTVLENVVVTPVMMETPKNFRVDKASDHRSYVKKDVQRLFGELKLSKVHVEGERPIWQDEQQP